MKISDFIKFIGAGVVAKHCEVSLATATKWEGGGPMWLSKKAKLAELIRWRLTAAGLVGRKKHKDIADSMNIDLADVKSALGWDLPPGG